MKFTIRAKLLSAIAGVTVIVGVFIALTIFSGIFARSQLTKVLAYDDERAALQDLQLQISEMWQYFTDASLMLDQGNGAQQARTAFDAAMANITMIANLEPDEADRQRILDFKVLGLLILG